MVDVTTLERAETRTPEDGVYAKQLAAGSRMNVQHVRIDPDTVTSEHSHPHEQVTYVLDGAVTMVLEGDATTVPEGGSIVVPGDVLHYAKNDGADPVTLLDVFSPVRTELLR